MRDITTLRLELGISAERLVSQLMVDNRQIEDALQAGIKKGLDELFSNENFESMVANHVKEAVKDVIKEAARSYALKHKIHEAIFAQIDDKVMAIAKTWADKLEKQIESPTAGDQP